MKNRIKILSFFIILSFISAQNQIQSNQYNIAGGIYYSMAVNSDRTLTGWGSYNSSADNLSNVFSIARNYFGTGILYTDGTVAYIGSGEGGPQNVPENLNNVRMLIGGADHLLALRSDGTVVAWGKDDTGQATVPSDLSGTIVGMSAGDNHSTVLFSDGTCRNWGNVSSANNFTDIRPVPEAIASGRGFDIAIKNDGTVIAAGSNSYGQTDVPDGLSDVVAVACGNYHSIALKSDGTVVAWGRNEYGQTDVPEGLDNVVAIAGGMKGSHTIALKSDGTVVAWGRDDYEQSSGVPVDLDALVYVPLFYQNLNNQNTVSAGYDHNLILHADGTVTALGRNSSGQSTVPDNLSDVVAVSAGREHSMALRSDGTVVTWGGESSNEYGDAQMPDNLSNVIAISANRTHSMALRSDSTVVAWGGENTYGQHTVPDGLSDVIAISAGAYHSLVLHSDGTVTGWGKYQDQIPEDLSNIIAITAGKGNSGESYALSSDGTVNIWGYASSPPDDLSDVLSLSAGQSQVVALLGDGTVVTWGWNNEFGQLDLPDDLLSENNVVGVYAGYRHSMALLGDGTIIGWGANHDNQLNTVCAGECTGTVISENGEPLVARVYTYVPDDNFEQTLIYMGYDDILDNYVLKENISGATSLDVSNKSISDLTGIEGFTQLEVLSCRVNQLTSLDVSNNTDLTHLSCDQNQITSLDVSNNLDLENLGCGWNQLTSLDVSSNTALERLSADNNSLTALDVSSNTELFEFLCHGNDLYYLNLKFGDPSQLQWFNATNNDLTCIETIDPVWATANWTYENGKIDQGVEFSVVCAPEGYTYVPDNNFEQALIDLDYDDVLNDFVLTENISGVTSLDVNGKEISDLTGIEDFTALTYLNCNYNQLTRLDVSSNTALITLYCHDMIGRSLTSLVLGTNTALTTVQCNDNRLTALDVSSNTALEKLECHTNHLTSLDVSNNTALTWLTCGYNDLTALDVSNNTALTKLTCENNELISLDLSSNTALTYLALWNNELIHLNMKNGVTDQLTFFKATGNSFDCIEVNADDIAYATANWTNANGNIDDGVDFSVVCAPEGYTYVPDNNFEQALVDLGYDDVVNDFVLTENISGVTELNVNAKEISDLTGIEDFTALTRLYCGYQQLTSLDMSSNTALTYLSCIGANYDGDLTSLNVSNNTALTELWCYGNKLTSLDLSNNTALTTLYSRTNPLDELDLSNNTALTHLNAFDNTLTSLDLSNNILLEELRCQNNELTSLDLSSNTALRQVYCSGNQLFYLNMKNGITDQLTSFGAANNDLTCIETLDPVYATENWTYENGKIDQGVEFSVVCVPEGYTYVPDDNFEQALIDLDYDDVLNDFVLTANISGVTNLNVSVKEISDLTGIEDFTALTTLQCTINNLTSLDLSNNTALTYLECQQNNLTSLDFSNNTALSHLYVMNNNLTSLDVSSNTALQTLYTNNNSLTSLDLSSNTALTKVYCNGNQLIHLNMKNGVTDQLTNFNATDNSLDCIEVNAEDVDYATENWTYANENIDEGVEFSVVCTPEGYTYVPDNNFEQALVDLGYDDVVNDFVLTANISGVTSMTISNYQNEEDYVSDLTGIGGFTALTTLNVSYNSLTTLDMSNNTALTYLNCGYNQLTSLDLSANTALTQLECGSNQLTSLDVSNITALEDLRCNANQLTSLDVSLNTALTVLEFSSNQLTSLDVSNNTALDLLNFSANQLTSMDVSSNTALTGLYFNANQLTSLDVSSNTALTLLWCGDNQLTSLDLSNNTALTNINCSYNSLTFLDVSSITGLTYLDCASNQLTSLDLSSNTALTNLICRYNQLTSLDVSANTALTQLWCGDNQLTSLNVSNNTALNSLYVSNNELTSLDVNNNTALTNLICSDNQLTSLDVSNNTALYQFSCGYNQLTSLDVSSNTALELFYCTHNQLTYLNMRNGITEQFIDFSAKNNSLTCVEVNADDVAYATANWTNEFDVGVTFDFICGSEARTHWYVATTGSDASGSGTLASPLATIQTAINVTTESDTVSVAAGTYVENIDFGGKNIAVIGADRETTIIDGNQAGSVVQFEYYEDSTAVLSGFTIQNGASTNFAGGIQVGWASPTLTNLIVKNNSTTFRGGGISMGGNPTLSNVEITGNSAVGYGGGINKVAAPDDSDETFLSNVLIIGNSTGYNGGGIYLSGGSNMTLTNVTIANNSYTSQGGGIYLHDSCSVNLVNSIVRDNEYPEIYFDTFGDQSSPNDITVAYSNIAGGLDGIITNDNGTVTWGVGNVDIDPVFVDADNDDYHLSDLSPVISAAASTVTIDGVTYTAPTTDIEGNPRPNPAGTVPDMGAYENENGAGLYNGPVWYVDASSELPYANGSESAKFSKIQYGINAAANGDTVSVVAGTYVENINYNGKNIAVIGADRETTIIDGDQNGSVVVFENGEGAETVLSGFTLTNGYAEFEGNQHPYTTGGGILFHSGSSPRIENMIITNNSGNAGGGISCVSGSSPTLNNVIISNNDSEGSGGGMMCSGSSPTLTHVLFTGNSAPWRGGGIGVSGASSNPTFTNVTLIDNQSSTAGWPNSGGGGIAFWGGADCSISNSIFFGNNPDEIYLATDEPPNSINITYSNIQESWEGEGNIDVDPMFVDTANGNYHLLASSMLINAGDPDSTDSDGSRADIGAYPYLNSYSGPTWYISESGNDTTATGASDDPFRSIQSGINFSSGGDSVTVAAGTYVENINFRGRNIKVVGENRETTIIDGDSSGTVVTFSNGEDFTTVLSGFTIQNGYLYSTDPTDGLNGGGVSISNASPTLKNLIVKNCTAFYGGGIWVSYSSSLLDSIKVFNNASQSHGGGVYLDYSNAVLNNVSIYNNTTVSGGHAAGLFINNDYQDTSSPKIIQSLIEGNTADYGAGAIYMDACNPIFYKTNIINNVGGWQSIANPGGVFVTGTSNASFTNCIIQDNSDDEIEIDPNGNPSSVSIYYSNVEGGQDSITTNNNGTVTWGNGNIDVDPHFLDAENDDYHLLASSQLINAGHPDSTDSDGTVADIGAYPYLNSYSGPTWYITESGNDTTATGASNDPFRSIQSGINFSSDTDSVTVAAGTYVENINFRGRNIKVVGADRETTIIDGDSTEAVVIFINNEDSSATLKNFTIQNGYTLPPFSTSSGGGIRVMSSSPTLINLIVKNNRANDMGGGLFLASSNSVLQNLEISSNIANKGGGISVGNSDPVLTNVTIVDNAANNTGGGVYADNGASIELISSIMWENVPQGIDQNGTGSINITYSDIETGVGGVGNIDIYPMFVDTANGDYHLLATSQLINGGHPDSTDSDGSRADIGAYPYLNSYSGPTWYISESGNDTTATGASDDPFRSIQSGINFSNDADSVTVAAGTYVENINFRGRNIKVVGEDLETTIIDGDSLNSVVRFTASDQSYTATLKNFTVRNGFGIPYEDYGWYGGSGVYVENEGEFLTTAIIEQCIIRDNTLPLSGKGIAIFFNFGSTGIIKDCIFTNNNNGAEGVIFSWGPYQLQNCVFNDNYNGNIIYHASSFDESPLINNCVFFNNHPGGNGNDALIHTQMGTQLEISNSIIWNNDQDSLWFDQDSDPDASVTISFSDVQFENQDGEGIINVDPLFVDPVNGDYHLLVDSRLIDAGHPDSTDADGTIADMGAYYYDQAGQPVRVSNLITTPAADNVSVRWNANSAAASYNIYRSIDGSADFYSLSPYTTESDTLYIDETAADNTTYHYRVSAVNGGGYEGILAYSDHGRRGNDTTALSMGADDSWISVSDPRAPVFSPAQDYTVEFYFRPLGYGNEAQTMLRASSLSLDLIPIGSDSFKIHLVDESGSFTGGSPVPIDSGWHHLAVTAPAGENIKLWLDGHLDVVDDGFVTLLGNSGVDFNNADPSNSYEGILDEVRFSNSLRYTSAFVPPGDEFQVDENTLALWRLNEGSFDETMPAVYDWSGNGYHGLVSSTTNPDWVSGSPTQPEGQSAFVINELMPNPSGSDGGKEWIELYNQWFTPLYLQGWSISGGGGGETVTLSDNVAIPPGGYALLAQSSDTTSNGGIDPQIEYGSGISLSNAGETISIKDGAGTVVESVTYTSDFPFASGASMELIVPQWDNSVSISWVTAGIPYGDGVNLGSPGRKNDAYSGVVDVSIDTINFSYVTEGEEQSASFFIRNSGVAKLQVSQISTLTEVFSIDPEQADVAVGDSVEIEVLFMPPVVGSYVDTVTISSDDPYTPLVTMVLSGSGINEFADISVTDGVTESISVLNFPFTRVNEAWTDTLYVINLGSPDLEIEEIFLEGDAEFSTPGDGGMIAFMDTLVVPVTFSPAATGTYTANLVVGSSDPDESSYTVVLNGESASHIILVVPTFFATIQEAIVAAYPEDTVEVLSGTYEESLDLLDKNLVLRSVTGPDSTLIEGDGTGPVLTISGGQSNLTMVNGFTLTGGGGTAGGGIKIDGSSTPVLHHLILSSNAVSGNGGGIAIMSGGADLSFTSISNNTAAGSGGALYAAASSAVTIDNSILWNNGNTEIGSFDNVTITYSIVAGGAIDADPLFVNGPALDFSLQWPSPAIDAGDPSSNPDPDGTIVDMGAIAYDQSFQPPDPVVAFSGVGGNGFIDLAWSEPVDPRGNINEDIVDYTLYHGTDFLELDSLDLLAYLETTYLDDGGDAHLINGQEYFYVLVPRDTSGLYSAINDTISVVPAGGTMAASDTVHNFGSVEHNALASWELIISNPGNDTLTLDTIYTSSAWYSVSEISVTVPAQDSVTVLVQFQPDLTPGNLLDTLIISGDDLDNSELNIPLSGESVWPVLDLSETELSFGDIRVGILETMQVTLSNTGSDTLFVDSIYVADDLSGFNVALGEMTTSRSLKERIAISKSLSVLAPSKKSGLKGGKSDRTGLSSKNKSSSQPLSLNNNTGSKKASTSLKTGSSSPVKTGSFSPVKSPVIIGKQSNQLTANSVLTISSEVMPGESIGLDVSFMRDDTLTVVDELRITSDDPLGNDVVSIGLSGRSVAPVLVLAADTLDFGHILSESQLSVMVSNDGTDTLNVSAMAFPSGFTGSLADSTLAPGEAAELTVSIAPEDNGYWTGDVLLTSDSYQQPEHSVALSALSMNTLLDHDYGGVLTSLSSDTTFTFNNTGNTDLVLDSLRTGQAAFTTDLVDGTTVSSGGSQSIVVTFAPTTPDTVEGAVVLHTAPGSIAFGTLVGDGWNWPEAQFSAKSLSAVTYVNNDTEFDIELTNLGDYPLDYTTTVNADFGGWVWLSADEGGNVSGNSTALISLSVQNTSNLDPGIYSGFIYFGTNTGGSDPDLIIANTDTVNVFLTLLGDDSQIADTTVSIAAGNTDAIVITDENGDPLGVTLDFVNSSGGSVTVQAIDAQPPVDENTPWVDPDGLITEPVFPAKYFEITTDIEGAFLTDIGFDYTTLIGVSDLTTLRLAKRPGNAGLSESWAVVALSDTDLDEANGTVVAKNQTSFSQWAMISNSSDNSFTDTQGPVIGAVSLSPTAPATGVEVVVSANITDDTGISQSTLHYAVGGNWSYSSVPMTSTGTTYSGTIPATDVTYNGLVYYIQSQDATGSAYTTQSDTTALEVIFSGSAITTAMSGSQHPNGITMDAWRMISLPAVPDDKTITINLVDELGTQDDNIWKMFRLSGGSYAANPTTLNAGEGYWIYQRVAENLALNMSTGKSGDLDGVSVTVPAGGWTFMSAPYPFAININLDQASFYGPITYGTIGEGWTDVVTTLQPWGGYALYNRTGAEQTVLLNPAQGSGGLAARIALDNETGWQVAIEAQSGDYFDRYNRFGCLESASNELDWHDNPEMAPMGNHISMYFNSIIESSVVPMTSDLRQTLDHVQIWDGEITGSGLTESVELSWNVEKAAPGDIAVNLIDLNTRNVLDLSAPDQYLLGDLDDRYSRQVKIVAGDPEQVALAVDEILATIPEELSLDGNYPNPFNPVTTIRFGLPEPRKIRITVVNLLGQEITELVNGWRDIGRHEVVWQGQDHQGRPVATGMYFTVLSDGNKIIVQKMLLLK